MKVSEDMFCDAVVQFALSEPGAPDVTESRPVEAVGPVSWCEVLERSYAVPMAAPNDLSIGCSP